MQSMDSAISYFHSMYSHKTYQYLRNTRFGLQAEVTSITLIYRIVNLRDIITTVTFNKVDSTIVAEIINW